MHLPKQKQSKLYSKSKELVFTGYLDVSKKYRRLNAKEKLFNTCDVVIIEDIIWRIINFGDKVGDRKKVEGAVGKEDDECYRS